MGFSRQEYWSGLPLPSPGDLPDPGTVPASPALQAVSYIAGRFFTNGATWEAPFIPACLCAKSLQLCLTLCNPMDCSPSGSSVHGTSQARILEWVAISYFRGSSQPRDRTRVSNISCIARQVLTTSATWEAPIGTQIIVPHANIGIYFYILLLYYLHCFFKL